MGTLDKFIAHRNRKISDAKKIVEEKIEEDVPVSDDEYSDIEED